MRRYLILIILPAVSTAVSAQTVQKWLRLPPGKPPRIYSHSLEGAADTATTLKFRFAKEPVKGLLQTIHRNFPESASQTVYLDETYDLGRSTIILEELFREAEETFNDPLPTAPEETIMNGNPAATATMIIAPETAADRSHGQIPEDVPVASATPENNN